MKSVVVTLETRLPVEDLLALPTDDGLDVEPDFSDAELQQLADRFGVPAINAVSGTVRIKRWRGKGLSLRGTIQAALVQTCVVTLDPVDQQIAAELDVMLFPGADPLDMDSDIDPLPADAVAVGEIIAEHIALEIDPYPRKPGVEFADSEPKPAEVSPFQVLAALKNDKRPS